MSVFALRQSFQKFSRESSQSRPYLIQFELCIFVIVVLSCVLNTLFGIIHVSINSMLQVKRARIKVESYSSYQNHNNHQRIIVYLACLEKLLEFSSLINTSHE